MSEVLDADVCIVGAGIAGLFTAWALPPGLHTVVLDKGLIGQGSTPLAQGGMAAAFGAGDSWQRHVADTVAAGAKLVDVGAAEAVCREALDRVKDLVDLGCEFDRNRDGTLHLAREGGQSIARSVHKADATGAEIARALRLAAAPRVQRVEAVAYRLALAGQSVRGVWANGKDGPLLVRARTTMLALGGAGGLFSSTTNNPASTGDAIAMARLAGVRLADLEFVQFHPTALAVPESPRPLLTEALRGAGATLIDANGRRIMEGVHPDGDLAPRHVVTAAILDAGEVYLDARSLGPAVLDEEFPTVVHSCRERGFDPVTQPIPVVPAAHYMIGGVATDLHGRASLPGLYAAGESAATGIHGANRLAGNSLSESAVFASRAAAAMEMDSHSAEADPAWETPPAAGPVTEDLRSEIVAAVTLGAGPVRDAKSAHKALETLKGLTPEGGTPSLITSGELLIRAALAREETRGVHVRSDFPETNAELDGVHFSEGRRLG